MRRYYDISDFVNSRVIGVFVVRSSMSSKRTTRSKAKKAESCPKCKQVSPRTTRFTFKGYPDGVCEKCYDSEHRTTRKAQESEVFKTCKTSILCRAP
jgi:hypothetical protein